jgi:hypothetical protein
VVGEAGKTTGNRAARAIGRARRTVRQRAGGLLLLCALGIQALTLAPEVSRGRLPVNDLVFHLAASERLGASLVQDEPFLDPWVSEWALGYPVWRSYQPLSHLVGALVIAVARPLTDPATAFAAWNYVLLVLLPLTAYATARLLGVGSFGAGLAALLILAPSGAGDLGRFGCSYGAFVWRGSGLYSQLVGLHMLLLSVGVVTHALDTGRWSAVAALLLAATVLSHLVFGYVAFASAAICTLVGPAGARGLRVRRLLGIYTRALLLLVWFILPALLVMETINRSRWEAAFKWNSFGAGFILRELMAGRLFDAGRLPVLSLLIGVGACASVWRWHDPAARRLLALTAIWLALFFGRSTWDGVLPLLGIPAAFHLHRLQAALDVFAVLLAAWGTAAVLQWLLARPLVFLLAEVAVVAGIAHVLIDRAHYEREAAPWVAETESAFAETHADLDTALAHAARILEARPGRVSAGKAATWGNEFKVGRVPVFAFLTAAHFDQVSFLYHAMSRTGDLMVLRDESNPAHDRIFAVRVVIAPADRPMPEHLERRGTFGPFAVYEASPEGYVGLVDIGGRWLSGARGLYEASEAWLSSPWARDDVVLTLDDVIANVPIMSSADTLATVPAAFQRPRGRVLEETKDGEVYRARVEALRPCFAVVRITWHPDLVAELDGTRVPLTQVTPGFAALALPPGNHRIVVRYEPGPLKPLLLIAGVAAFVLLSLRRV